MTVTTDGMIRAMLSSVEAVGWGSGVGVGVRVATGMGVGVGSEVGVGESYHIANCPESLAHKTRPPPVMPPRMPPTIKTTPIKDNNKQPLVPPSCRPPIKDVEGLDLAEPAFFTTPEIWRVLSMADGP
jgi:hypothetical protein